MSILDKSIIFLHKLYNGLLSFAFFITNIRILLVFCFRYSFNSSSSFTLIRFLHIMHLTSSNKLIVFISIKAFFKELISRSYVVTDSLFILFSFSILFISLFTSKSSPINKYVMRYHLFK